MTQPTIEPASGPIYLDEPELPRRIRRRDREPLILLVVGFVCLAISAIHPYETGTWFMEVAPIFIAVPILLLSYNEFPLTPLLYRLILVHALILMVGGHYTYARVPLGYYMQALFDLHRNDYDRIGHFAQGFVPALIAREILIRRSPVTGGKWLFFIVTCIALAISACYEFIEWWSALIGGASATDFLGTQGDPFDTQSDMLMALIGAVIALLTLAKVQDRAIAHLRKRRRGSGHRHRVSAG